MTYRPHLAIPDHVTTPSAMKPNGHHSLCAIPHTPMAAMLSKSLRTAAVSARRFYSRSIAIPRCSVMMSAADSQRDSIEALGQVTHAPIGLNVYAED